MSLKFRQVGMCSIYHGRAFASNVHHRNQDRTCPAHNLLPRDDNVMFLKNARVSELEVCMGIQVWPTVRRVVLL